jgi:Uma2 family endonuclease
MFAAKMPSRWISPEEYLHQEDTATERHEYFNGKVSLLEGGMHNHEMVRCNLLMALHRHVRRRAFTVLGCNMKIMANASGFISYPDILLISGKTEFAPERKDIVTNPLLIVEVLSASTQSYDRGDKFALYRGIPAFAHYLLIHQDQPLVEYHQKTKRGWLLSEIAGIDAVLSLAELECDLPFTELYTGVDWLTNLAPNDQ